MRPHAGRHSLHVDAFEWLPLNPGPPVPTAFPYPRGEEWIVAGGHDVDRGSHQGALDGPTLLQGLGQVLATESLQARPESHICRRGVLCLEAGHALKGVDEWNPRAFEEQLSGQQRAVEFGGGEDALGHGCESHPAAGRLSLTMPGRGKMVLCWPQGFFLDPAPSFGPDWRRSRQPAAAACDHRFGTCGAHGGTTLLLASMTMVSGSGAWRRSRTNASVLTDVT